MGAGVVREVWLDVGSDEFRPAAVYLATVVGVFLVGVAAATLVRGEPVVPDAVMVPVFFPVLFTYAPPVVAAAHAVRGGGPVGALAVGLGPGVAFAVLVVLSRLLGIAGRGDSPAWALGVVFAGVGVAGAAVGYLVGYAVREAVVIGRDRKD